VSDDRPTGVIELSLPADARLVRLARLVASGVATAAGFDVEEVEDLRIAVDELCGALVEGGNGEPLELVFELRDEEVHVLGSTGSGGVDQLDEQRIALSRQILDVVVDSHEVTAVDGTLRVRLHKRHDVLIDG
jgi:serine/threonine-protein kinase RsbW